MALQKLKLESTFYHEDVVIFGLVSTLPGYRLSYFLNESIGLSLKRSIGDKPHHYKKELFYYSQFEFEDEKRSLDWFLIANKNPILYNEDEKERHEKNLDSRIVSGLPLVPNLKIMDFFLGYYGEENQNINENIILQLRDLSYVSTYQKIDLAKTKNIDNLLIT